MAEDIRESVILEIGHWKFFGHWSLGIGQLATLSWTFPPRTPLPPRRFTSPTRA